MARLTSSKNMSLSAAPLQELCRKERTSVKKRSVHFETEEVLLRFFAQVLLRLILVSEAASTLRYDELRVSLVRLNSNLPGTSISDNLHFISDNLRRALDPPADFTCDGVTLSVLPILLNRLLR
mmetsp:Transcript_546/g.1814  ORF Transcript_546/g.1814 Transcript_546/m.1814 type:complete len:124 (-) Transcript_546:1229-1600(-)